MRTCQKCNCTWNDDVRICHYVTDKTHGMCGTLLIDQTMTGE